MSSKLSWWRCPAYLRQQPRVLGASIASSATCAGWPAAFGGGRIISGSRSPGASGPVSAPAHGRCPAGRWSDVPFVIRGIRMSVKFTSGGRRTGRGAWAVPTSPTMLRLQNRQPVDQDADRELVILPAVRHRTSGRGSLRAVAFTLGAFAPAVPSPHPRGALRGALCVAYRHPRGLRVLDSWNCRQIWRRRTLIPDGVTVSVCRLPQLAALHGTPPGCDIPAAQIDTWNRRGITTPAPPARRDFIWVGLAAYCSAGALS